MISPQNQVQFWRFLIPWNRFEVYFHKIPFSPISSINFSSDLIKFEDYIEKFLNSLWIRPIFTIIPLNSWLILKIGKFGIIFDAIPLEIDDLAVSSRHVTLSRYRPQYLTKAHYPVGPPLADLTRHVAPHTGGHVDPRGLLPRVCALCATCASRGPPAALPRGLTATSHQRDGPARHVSLPAGPTCHVSTCR